MFIMLKTISRWLLALFVLVVAVVLAGAWYFSGELLNPKRYPCNIEHYVFCETPAQIGLDYQDIELEASDNVRLSGWFIPGTREDAGIVLIHGRGATRHEGLRDAIALGKQGFPMVMIDLRNSGKSQPGFNSMGFHETKDVHAAVAFLRNQGIEKVGVVGYSMGASTSILAMAENPAIRAGWFDSGFTSIDDIIQERGREDYGIPAVAQFSRLVRWLYEIRGDLDTEKTPIDVIASIAPRPVMIVHGTADRVVSVVHGRALYQTAEEPKSYWEIPEGRHTRSYQADKKKSAQLIGGFFRDNLSGI
ncbi:alpha/beta hydrolase [Sansalvadorimonas verongulae]|uniref:alpha/beta hydrolase n=1 Tax=Sansalvadorimonas verongulae TaxID=2172824 RepID=UPI0012BD65BD|nr:alpha/beta fold hydrolase [Sansalvadorimonas verongulae]MTI12544.1 alpha/beta fold hydrolase [Sansalvadorimonas verongulae]